MFLQRASSIVEDCNCAMTACIHQIAIGVSMENSVSGPWENPRVLARPSNAGYPTHTRAPGLTPRGIGGLLRAAAD
jgi:hypothetical protein